MGAGEHGKHSKTAILLAFLQIGGLANVVCKLRHEVFDVTDGLGDVLCIVADIPNIVEDILCFVGDMPNVVADILGFGRDILRFVEDIPDNVQDIPDFVNDTPDEAEDIPNVVRDILSFAWEVRNFVPEWLRIWGEIAIGRRRAVWLGRRQSGSGCWRRKFKRKQRHDDGQL